MNDESWELYVLDGRSLELRETEDQWQARLGDRTVAARHLDEALSELLAVPRAIAVQIALAIFDASPGSAVRW